MVDAGESAQCPRIERLEARFNPLAISALIANVLRLFLLQAQMILSNPLAIVLMAIPLILQTHLIYWITAF
jgi:ACR3 family arsenite transporter|tara:strand:+ start:1182 stop:1394 length:213 start_codon:yes stop_codon:yes gene_type:complete